MNTVNKNKNLAMLDAHSDDRRRGFTRDAWRQIVPFSLIFLAACWLFFFELGKYPLFNPDEGLFAEPAREILDTGQWLTSLLNYVVRYTKPPLAMWAMALSYQVFGVNEFAARFVSAGSAALTVAVTYCFIARYAGSRAAAVGAGSLIVAPLFSGTARMAITDMPLTFFFSSSMFCFYRAFLERDRFFCTLAYILLGLAVMTKGPVAIVLALSILAAFHALAGSLRRAVQFYRPLYGALIVAAIALPWFAGEIIATRGAYFQAFILRENLERFSSVVDSHKGAWWYHILAMTAGYLPWSLFLPQALYRIIADCSCLPPGGSLENRSWIKQLRNLPDRVSLSLFAVLWLVVTLAFFSASVSKLLTYTLPAFPALAVVVGIEVVGLIEYGKLRQLAAPLAVLAVVYACLAIAVPVVLPRLRDCPGGLMQIVAAYAMFICLSSLVALMLTAARKAGVAVAAFAALCFLSQAYFGQRALSLVSQQWEGALPDFARYAATSSCPILLFDFRKPGIPFYTRRQVMQPAGRASLEARLCSFKQAYVLSATKDLSYFKSLNGCRIIAQQGHYMLVAWMRPATVSPAPAAFRQIEDHCLAN